MMKKKLLLFFLLISSIGLCQDINDYNYVIIPSKFSFFDEPNRYNLNTLSKLFMEKHGFTVYYDEDVLPDTAAKDQCKLYFDLVKSSNMFTTKLTVVLKDCRNAIVFTSAEGKSSEKEFRVAYTQALREAFKSFDNLNYKYSGKQVSSSSSATAPAMPIPPTPASSGVNTGVSSNTVSNGELINAQPIENGYQLVDTTPKIILKIYKTSKAEIFLAENESVKGVVLKHNGQWIFEYYQNGKMISKPLNIRF